MEAKRADSGFEPRQVIISPYHSKNLNAAGHPTHHKSSVKWNGCCVQRQRHWFSAPGKINSNSSSHLVGLDLDTTLLLLTSRSVYPAGPHSKMANKKHAVRKVVASRRTDWLRSKPSNHKDNNGKLTKIHNKLGIAHHRVMNVDSRVGRLIQLKWFKAATIAS